MAQEAPDPTEAPARREIRPDFPRTISVEDAEEIKRVIERELKKFGASLDQVGHITLLYPHKHPELFPGHVDQAKGFVDTFKGTVRQEPILTGIDWQSADGLVETVGLARTKNQSSVYSLMVHQIYDIHKPSQTAPLPSLEQKGEGREFAIVIDHMIMQGTTVANLMSHAENMGFTVLAVAEGHGGTPIAQTIQEKQSQDRFAGRFPADVSSGFNDASRNTGRLKELGAVFSDSVRPEGWNLTPDQCLALVEKGLNKNGNSVYAMTNGECDKLIRSIKEGSPKFSSFLRELGVKLPPKSHPRTPKSPLTKA